MQDGPLSFDGDEWLPSKIYLIDRSNRLIEHWAKVFSAFSEIEVVGGDYFQTPADAIVSPANSFGIMDGGLDLAIRNQLGDIVQSKIQRVIIEKYHGEMPIGCAEIVEIECREWSYIICAPTMRVPESVAFSINAYIAFRAVLVAIENFNKKAGNRKIDSLVCSGLCTGVGGMTASKCAGQMHLAYKSVMLPAVIGRFESIHAFHNSLREL